MGSALTWSKLYHVTIYRLLSVEKSLGLLQFGKVHKILFGQDYIQQLVGVKVILPVSREAVLKNPLRR